MSTEEQRTKDTRVFWMAWHEEDDGDAWIAALYGSTTTKEQMQDTIARIDKEYGRTNVRPVKVTVEIGS
jgi:hypothetical protein